MYSGQSHEASGPLPFQFSFAESGTDMMISVLPFINILCVERAMNRGLVHATLHSKSFFGLMSSVMLGVNQPERLRTSPGPKELLLGTAFVSIATWAATPR